MKFQSTKAFTIVEVIVAASVFTIAIVSIMAGMSRSRLPAAASDRRLIAASYAQQAAASLRQAVETGDSTGAFSDGVHALAAPAPGYTATYTVTTDGATGVRRVDLTVSW